MVQEEVVVVVGQERQGRALYGWLCEGELSRA